MATVVFFPEGAFGPTNNCVGIGDVLRRRGHRVVFVVEESFAVPRGQGLRGGRRCAWALRPSRKRNRGSSGRTSSARRRPSSVNHRAARGVHPADLAGTRRRREVRRAAPARDPGRARARRRGRGQRGRLRRAADVRAALGADRLLQPRRSPRCADLLRLRRGRPRGLGTSPAPSTSAATDRSGKTSTRSCASRELLRCRSSSSSTSRRR